MNDSRNGRNQSAKRTNPDSLHHDGQTLIDAVDLGSLADPNGQLTGDGSVQRSREHGLQPESCGLGSLDHGRRPGPVNGFWQNADWIFCRDGKWRPTKSASQYVADGLPGSMAGRGPDEAVLIKGEVFKAGSGHRFAGKSRMEASKGAGNSIVIPQAVAFIRAVMEEL